MTVKRKKWSVAYQKHLRALFSYDPNTGVVWRTGKEPPAPFANSECTRRYLRTTVSFEGRVRSVTLHRVAFLLMTGEQPEEIDHINGEVADNRWDNLRASTRIQNARNRTTKNGPDCDLPVGISRIPGKRFGREITRYRARVLRSSKTFLFLEQAIEWRRMNAVAAFGAFAPKGPNEQ